MNLVDVGIIVFVLALAAVGFERGLVASALPLAGFVGGAALGARVGPALLPDGAESSYAPLVAVLAGRAARRLRRRRPRRAQPRRSRRRVGRRRGRRRSTGSAAPLLLGALALLRRLGLRRRRAARQRRARRATCAERSSSSAILGVAQRRPAALRARCSTCCDGSTRARRSAGPDADVAPPDPASADDPDVLDAGGSTVRVLGTACGLGVEGSGWVAGIGLVVTNAHVVAGQDDTTVSVEGGAELDATAVHYDPRNDLAVLRGAGPAGSAAGARRAPAQGRPTPR